jgi:hypothetical protein
MAAKLHADLVSPFDLPQPVRDLVRQLQDGRLTFVRPATTLRLSVISFDNCRMANADVVLSFDHHKPVCDLVG